MLNVTWYIKLTNVKKRTNEYISIKHNYNIKIFQVFINWINLSVQNIFYIIPPTKPWIGPKFVNLLHIKSNPWYLQSLPFLKQKFLISSSRYSHFGKVYLPQGRGHMYVCMYVCMYLYLSIYIYIHIYIYIDR